MPNQSLASAMADGPGLDERRREIFRSAFSIVCKEEHLVLRESGNDDAHAIFDRDRGEMRIILDMTRHSEGEIAESLDLKIIEIGCLVFRVLGQRLRLGYGRSEVAVSVLKDTSSYWEAILKHIPL